MFGQEFMMSRLEVRVAFIAAFVVLSGCSTPTSSRENVEVEVNREGLKPLAPEWIIAPAESIFSPFYPEVARRRHLEAFTLIGCIVGLDEHLHACSVLKESPSGYGFGEAALEGATYLRMRPEIKNGKLTPAHITFPVYWQ